MKTRYKAIGLVVMTFQSFFLFAQTIEIEIGASKHFVPNAVNYEQPNLEIQGRHHIAPKFEYLISYYTITTYTSYPDHDILPWNGDPAELYARHIYGLDLSWNILSTCSTIKMAGLMVGCTSRLRDEIGFSLCQQTVDGWSECFMYEEKFIDLGISLGGYFDYYFLKNLGITTSVFERIYTADPSSFSLNLGLIYKFD